MLRFFVFCRNKDIIHERFSDFNAYFCHFYESVSFFPVFIVFSLIFVVISYKPTCLSIENICFLFAENFLFP